MNNQELLLKAIRQKLTQRASLIDEISLVLGISYDAAHRRVSQKSKFSIEEAVRLCRHFSLSMDAIVGEGNKVIVEKTNEIRSLADIADYFKSSAARLEYLKNSEKAQMFYSAKDIPLFHTIGGSLLSKFKLYVWLNLLRGSQNENSFENFTADRSLLEHSQKLKAVYESAEIHEIWNDTTINSTLQQIYYYYQSGLLSIANAKLICEDLLKVLYNVEERCCNGSGRYHLYYNELLILNNNVLVSTPERQSLFVPYTMLGYFITDDIATCNNVREYFKHQTRNSKSLNQSGTRDRKLFFNKAIQKVHYYLERITNEATLQF